MSEPPHDTSIAPSHNPTVPLDATCRRCGYNLTGLTLEDHCPECGTSIDYSFSGFLLANAAPVWVRRLARGTLVLFITACLQVVFALCLTAWIMSQAIANPTFSINISFAQHIGILAGIPVTILSIIGVLLLTSRERDEDEHWRDDPARIWIRRILVVHVLTWLVGTGISISQSILGVKLHIALLATSGVLSTAVLFLEFVLILRYLASLMMRIPRPGLAKFARILFWAFAIAGILMVVGQSFSIGQTAQLMNTLNASPSQFSSRGSVGMGSVQVGLPTNSTSQPATAPPPGTLNAIGYLGTTANTQSATVPPTAPPSAFAPARMYPTSPALIGQVASSCGSCIAFPFGIACFVFGRMACTALYTAARKADERAAAES